MIYCNRKYIGVQEPNDTDIYVEHDEEAIELHQWTHDRDGDWDFILIDSRPDADALCDAIRKAADATFGPVPSEADILREAIKAGGMDLSACRVCGTPVVCIGDGLTFCQSCGDKEADESGQGETGGPA